ncbi:unnamed protein product [Linum trigynum]|uniref:Uncharacterized protein n=1 Tax=Linum trigynum TaxID=586398 RepID=A0AAV2FXV2_9ROSI
MHSIYPNPSSISFLLSYPKDCGHFKSVDDGRLGGAQETRRYFQLPRWLVNWGACRRRHGRRRLLRSADELSSMDEAMQREPKSSGGSGLRGGLRFERDE